MTHLRWENIDLVGRTLHIPNTKNGDPLDLPLSGFLVDLFTARSAETEGSPWVFPGPGEEGHFIEIKRALKRVSETSGVKFTTHDLRRTFITIAESIDIPYYALKRMLNHRTSSDVTGGYIVIDAERLRAPVEQVAARINYSRTAEIYLKAWRKKPMDAITRQMVLKRHQELSAQIGKTTSAIAVRGALLEVRGWVAMG